VQGTSVSVSPIPKKNSHPNVHAIELAYRIPKRIASLVLAVTTPGGHIWNNFPPVRPVSPPSDWTCYLHIIRLHPQVKGLLSLTKLLFTPDPIKKLPIAMNMLFPVPWLAERATSDPHAEFNGNTDTNEMGKTNRDVQSEVRSVSYACIVSTTPHLFSSFRGSYAVSA